jgi:hypothetical protein
MRGSFSIYKSIIADGVELNFKLDFLLFEWVGWFWDLTCDFWAEFEEKTFLWQKTKGIDSGTFTM